MKFMKHGDQQSSGSVSYTHLDVYKRQTFPGNIELIKNYVYDHGVNYGTYPETSDIAKNDAGEWAVADVTTGAKLAGAPNYFNLIKQAYELIESGQGTPLSLINI